MLKTRLRFFVSISGPVSGTAGPVAVRPGQQISISTKLDLVFEIGGSEDR